MCNFISPESIRKASERVFSGEVCDVSYGPDSIGFTVTINGRAETVKITRSKIDDASRIAFAAF